MAFEDSYRLYREMIAAVIRVLRSESEVKSTPLEALEEAIERFDPQVVISSGHKEVALRSTLTWIELSMDSTLSAKISVGSRYLERINPTVEDLLKAIDEAR